MNENSKCAGPNERKSDPEPISIILTIIGALSGLGGLGRQIGKEISERRLRKARQRIIRTKAKRALETIESNLQELRILLASLRTIYESGNIDPAKAPFEIGGAALDLSSPEVKRFYRILAESQSLQRSLMLQSSKLGSYLEEVTPIRGSELDPIENFRENIKEMIGEFNQTVFALNDATLEGSKTSASHSHDKILNAIELLLKRARSAIKDLDQVLYEE
jgi:hypothetical protein